MTHKEEGAGFAWIGTFNCTYMRSDYPVDPVNKTRPGPVSGALTISLKRLWPSDGLDLVASDLPDHIQNHLQRLHECIGLI
jgi:hypothetical protein